MKKFSSILVISDTHFPYNHPDVLSFLKAAAQKYKPDKIVHIGDEVDMHSLSYHEHDPDLMGPNEELKTSINRLKPIYELFPDVDVLESNHGSMVYRKGRTHGLPKSVFKSYRSILEAPKGWKWHDELILYGSDGLPIYFCHSRGQDVLKLSQSMGMKAVQGHYHEKFEIRYWGNKLGLFWGMTVGCLIENKSLAFAYNKLNLKRPVIGCGAIIEGQAKLIPMILDKNGRWIERII